MSRQVIVQILGDATKFNAATRQATASAGKFNNVLKGIGQGLGISAFNTIESAIRGVVGVMGDAVRGAIEEQRSIARLTTALDANVEGWAGNTAAIEETIAAQLRLGFSDEEQRDSLSLLVAATKDASEALKIQRTAMDLARFKGISLKDATEALTKVEAGSYRILKSLGIELKAGATQTEALAAVQKVAAGQAESYARTIEGRALAASIRFDEKMEDLGAHTLPVASAALDKLINVMDRVDEGDTAGTFIEIGDALKWLNPMWVTSTLGINQLSSAQAKAAAQGRELSDKIDVMRRTAGRGFQPVDDLGGAIADTGDAADEAADEMKEFKDAMQAAFDTIIENSYDPEQLRLALAKASGETDNLTKKLAKLEAIKNPTADQRQDILDTKLALSENREQVDKLKVRVGLLNGASLSELKSAWQTLLRNGIKPNTAEALYLLRLLGRAAIRAAQIRVGTGPLISERASGGKASGLTWVGEEGPELLNLPRGSEVYSNAESMRMASTPTIGGGVAGAVTVNVHISGAGAILTPRQGQEIAKAIAPELTRQLARAR